MHITTISGTYGRYIEIVDGGYKLTNITGGYHIVELFQWKSTVESLVQLFIQGDTATQFYAAHQPILLFYVDFKGLNFQGISLQNMVIYIYMLLT